jgi:hypothetical protein
MTIVVTASRFSAIFKLKVGLLTRRPMRASIASADFRKFDDGLRMTLDCSLGSPTRWARLAAGCVFDRESSGGSGAGDVPVRSDRTGRVHFVDSGRRL